MNTSSLFKSMLLLLFILSGAHGLAASQNINGIYYNLSAADYSASVTSSGSSSRTYSGNIEIPSTVEYNGREYTVTSIGSKAFYKCTALLSVSIPSTVTAIGSSAFEGCKALTTANLPEQVGNIGSLAFADCESLDVVLCTPTLFAHLPQSFEGAYTVPDGITTICSGAFYGCTGMSEVTIPSSVLSIETSAFFRCNSLKSLIISDGAETLNMAFNVTPLFNNSSTDGLFFHCPLESLYLGRNLTYSFIQSTSIRWANSPFEKKQTLTQITIGPEVTVLGTYLFFQDTGLTDVTIPGNVKTISRNAFSGCSALQTVTIGEGVETLQEGAFANCSALTTVSLANSVQQVGQNVFYMCPALATPVHNSHIFVYMPYEYEGEYAVPDGIEEICGNAFVCPKLTSVTLPSSLKRIGELAFYSCEQLHSVILPDHIEYIANRAFNTFNNFKFYANKGTCTLLAVWNAYKNGYHYIFETGDDSEQPLTPPYLQTWVTVTQTTATCRVHNMYEEYDYTGNDGQPLVDGQVVLTGLMPEYTDSIRLYVSLHGVTYYTATKFTTASLSPTVEGTVTASSITAKGNYRTGDAKVTSASLRFNGQLVSGDSVYVHGLEPATSYPAEYTVRVIYAPGKVKDYTGRVNITTAAAELVPQQPKVASPGNVIVAAKTNLDDAEENVGFEWRRTDWTDDFTSNQGAAFLYEGTMEGYIRNLNTEKLWKFRAYYESRNGNRHYGEWMGIDPTNTSYFEPTVHTYATITVDGNTANVKGYVMRGSDNITMQGFKYWPQTANIRGVLAGSIPSDALTMEASGNIMEARLANLSYNTNYCCVAFVTTSEGETFYGDLRQFATGADLSGIGNTMADAVPTPEAYYDLNGHRLDAPMRGVNIIRMSDGTSRKIVVR